jgi:hypothetical protein
VTRSAWRSLGPAALVCAAAPAFFVLGWTVVGCALLIGGIGSAALLERRRIAAVEPSLTRDLALIGVGMLIVHSIPLAAELDDGAMLRFTLALGGAVLVPYLVSRFVFRDRAISFPWRTGRRWAPWQWIWLVAVLALGWLILPFYFITSGVYLNWPVVDSPDLIGRLFVGVGAVGIWDELDHIRGALHLGESLRGCSSSARCSRCCAGTCRTPRRTCCRRRCSSRSSGSSATAHGGRC